MAQIWSSIINKKWEGKKGMLKEGCLTCTQLCCTILNKSQKKKRELQNPQFWNVHLPSYSW